MTRERIQNTLATARRTAQAGFSLIELMVASAIFLMIMVAVYTVYMGGLESHKLGVNQAELVQSTRFGFEEMATRIRSAGFEFDLDGTPSDSPNQSDESIEYMGERAIIVRANYDFASEQLRGREEAYERPEGTEGCCPIVTTGNDEIIAFALGKDEGSPDQPTETMTAYFDLGAPRSGRIATATQTIVGEGTVEIPNVALTDFSDPPYTLYQFTWTDPDGSGTVGLVRRPLVDNILELQFRYFDEGGNPITPNAGGPNPSADGAAQSPGRRDRERVRKVEIRIKGMTPDPDLRYVDPNDADPTTQKHRKFELVQEVHTFNVGRRGQRDQDDDPPEGVSDVQLCSGQCGMVRVDWKPGPPEERISDHLVILAVCPGGTGPNWDDPLASFLVVSDLDISTNPAREYAIFDVDDDADLVAGVNVCARVIPRNQSGAESLDPADSDRNSVQPEPTPNDYTIIEDYTRPEAPSRGRGSGFDEEHGQWPNARADNAASGVRVTTSSAAASYPLENRISLSFRAPEYQLNRSSVGGGNRFDWTTDPAASGSRAALEMDVDPGEICYRSESSPFDDVQNWRTPVEELAEIANPSRPNVYVFRVSGSDLSNFGPNQSDCSDSGIDGPSCIRAPRNFMPWAGNLHSYVSASLAGGTFSFEDSSSSSFYRPEGATDPYLDRYLATGTHPVTPEGRLAPVQALTPGEVYYYRVRVVDNCWTDADRDGVEDSTEGTAQPLTAWSTVDDFPDEDAWRQAAVTLTPFYPPLLAQSGSGNRDKPATGEDDSDAVDLGSLADELDTHALPGYAIPRFVQGNTYMRPEKPTELYLARANDSASDLLTSTEALYDTDGDTIPERMGVRVLFNSAKRDAPQDTTGASGEPAPVGYTWYRLERKEVSYDPINGGVTPANEVNFQATQGELVAEFRLSEDGIRDYTIDRRGEVFRGMNSFPNNDALLVPSATLIGGGDDTLRHFFYKLFTVQVSPGTHHDPAGGNDDPLPPHVSDDGITPPAPAVRYSVGSRGFLFPSAFYDSIAKVRVLPTPSSGLNVQSIELEVTLGDTLDEDCSDDIGSYRLLAYDYQTDNHLGSSDWIAWAGGPTCDATIGSGPIQDALRGFPDRARFRVELSEVDETGNNGGAWDVQPRGARVRSDLVGAAGDYELSTTCTANCGTNDVNGADPPNILGRVTEEELTTHDGDRVLRMEIEVLPCNTEDFSLLQVEVVLESPDPMPRLINAELSGLRTGTMRLPAPEFAGADGGNHRYRWFEGSFCDDSGVCSFPVIDSASETIELRLRYDGPVCDPVRLLELNYRVLVDVGTGLEELLCSQRGDTGTDAPGGADEPDHYCSTTGTPGNDCGRGPAVTEEPCGQNPDCVPDCAAGTCPANSDFSVDPDVFLDDSMAGSNRVVRVEQREDCSQGCALGLVTVRAEFRCNDALRDCAIENLPAYLAGSAKLIHEDGSESGLGAPTVNDHDPDDHLLLEWLGLSDLEVLPGERFSLEFELEGSMVDTQLATWHLQFGSPLPATADCNAAAPLDIPN